MTKGGVVCVRVVLSLIQALERVRVPSVLSL